MDDLNSLNNASGLISGDDGTSADDFFAQFINTADTNSGLVSADSLEDINNGVGLISADSEGTESVSKITSAKEKVQSRLKNIDDKAQSMENDQAKKAGDSGKTDLDKVTQAAGNAVAAALSNQAIPAAQKPNTASSAATDAAKPAAANTPVKKDRKPVKFKNPESIQAYADEYVASFKRAFDIDLIPSIVYENMNKLMHPDIQGQNAYFMCNTYRLSTFMYIMDLLVPWVYSTMLLNTVSSSNLKLYKDIVAREIDIHAKSNSDALLALYKKRYIDRINNCDIRTDSVMITLGVTDLPEIYTNNINNSIRTIAENYSKNNDMKFRTAIPKLNGEDIDNLKYVHSNFWYMLQLFEYNIDGKRDSMVRIALKMINMFGK